MARTDTRHHFSNVILDVLTQIIQGQQALCTVDRKREKKKDKAVLSKMEVKVKSYVLLSTLELLVIKL